MRREERKEREMEREGKRESRKGKEERKQTKGIRGVKDRRKEEKGPLKKREIESTFDHIQFTLSL